MVTTVKNERKNIEEFLNSVIKQTKKPDEFIIVDGGSTDGTYEILKKYAKKYKWIKLYLLSGATRGEGRDFGVKKAKYNIIAFTDCGCLLHNNWLKELVKPFKNKKTDIVVGIYRPYYTNDFEFFQGIIVVPQPEKIFGNPSRMSIRSFALKKRIWLNNPYPKIEPGDDTLYNLQLMEKKYNFVFTKKAVVYWLMKNNIKSFFKQFYNYGRGDLLNKNLFRMKKNLMIVTSFWCYLFLVVFFLLTNRIIAVFLLTIYFVYLFLKSLLIFLQTKKLSSFLYVPVLETIKRTGYILGATPILFKKRDKK